MHILEGAHMLEGGFKPGGWVSRFGLVRPDLPFFLVLGSFQTFLGLVPIFAGIFPTCLLLSSRLPTKTTYKEHSRLGLGHNQDLS